MDGNATLLLTLYVAGETPASSSAIAELRACCEGPLEGRYAVDVVDIRREPRVAQDDRLLVQVLATPALISVLPPPLKRIIIDDLIMHEQILLGINLEPAEEALLPTGGFG